jgi:hypothetical protein
MTEKISPSDLIVKGGDNEGCTGRRKPGTRAEYVSGKRTIKEKGHQHKLATLFLCLSAGQNLKNTLFTGETTRKSSYEFE